jgi:hypothetical protein
MHSFFLKRTSVLNQCDPFQALQGTMVNDFHVSAAFQYFFNNIINGIFNIEGMNQTQIYFINNICLHARMSEIQKALFNY